MGLPADTSYPRRPAPPLSLFMCETNGSCTLWVGSCLICCAVCTLLSQLYCLLSVQSLRMEEEKTARLRDALWQEGAVKREWESLTEVNTVLASFSICLPPLIPRLYRWSTNTQHARSARVSLLTNIWISSLETPLFLSESVSPTYDTLSSVPFETPRPGLLLVGFLVRGRPHTVAFRGSAGMRESTASLRRLRVIASTLPSLRNPFALRNEGTYPRAGAPYCARNPPPHHRHRLPSALCTGALHALEI